MENEIRYINAYEKTLGYGGPEEGGWWYDIGEPLASIPVTTDEEEEAAVRRLRELFDPKFKNRRPAYSVDPDAADLIVCCEDHPAKPFPEARPHYE